MTDTADKIAKLEAEVAALKEKVSPPKEKPFVPQPYQQYDPTANMSMPPSALRAMVEAVPDHVVRGIVHDNRAPTGRPGMIPTSQQPTGPNVPERGTGWRDATPIGPPPGIQVDALCIADEVRQRAELKRKLGG